jgi:hypothetical protein
MRKLNEDSVKIVKVLENKYKIMSSGTYVTRVLADTAEENGGRKRFNVILATNRGYLKVFDLSNLLKKVEGGGNCQILRRGYRKRDARQSE